MTDVIDELVGILPGDRLDALRAARPNARAHAQGSFDALFVPDDTAHVTILERDAVATFTTALQDEPETAAFYADRLRASAAGRRGLAAAVGAEAARGRAVGPYGSFHGAHVAESVSGPQFRVGDDAAAILGPRLTAAIAHAHLLTLHPRDAARDDLQRLLDAGWSTTGIVTLSQLVSFLAFQIRVVHGLRVLQRRIDGEVGPEEERGGYPA